MPAATRGKPSPQTKPAPAAPEPEPTFAPDPFKPRPRLLALLSCVFALWVTFLLALYFKTEYPGRSTAPRPDAQGNLSHPAPTPSER